MTSCGLPTGSGVRHEVLHRRAVAVDRSLVEIWPKLLDRILERLAMKA